MPCGLAAREIIRRGSRPLPPSDIVLAGIVPFALQPIEAGMIVRNVSDPISPGYP